MKFISSHVSSVEECFIQQNAGILTNHILHPVHVFWQVTFYIQTGVLMYEILHPISCSTNVILHPIRFHRLLKCFSRQHNSILAIGILYSIMIYYLMKYL